MSELTKEFLISRGECCGNGCKNCPYSPSIKGETQLALEFNQIIDEQNVRESSSE
jgi:hypothetical protein